MKKVFIKYNPFTVTTEITIDGKALKRNSRLNVGEKRLQEWIDDLPSILFEECNTKDFEITFHGTTPDFEDLIAVAEDAKDKGISIKVNHIPAKEVKDKENSINKIFEKIQQGPFDEFKAPDVVKAFNLAKSSDFEVSVVATMSAGKSTLINSLLGQKLMPAKQEACTATITEIKDNDLDHFTAKVFNKEGSLIESYEDLTYDIMERLNSNKDVSRIHVEGDIPFVTAEDVSLVLLDTPGPNNSRDPEHQAATYRMLKESSKTLVLYIMNATQLAVNDDNNLLDHVAESMKVGGKQSRDRFIFVVNKLDDFRKGEDSVEAALKKVKDYLADKGIDNPNVYPASALTALNIRTILKSSDDDDDDDVYEAKGKVRKFNRNEEMHFEKYAPLPASVKGRINNLLDEAINSNNDNQQALIHCGVVPIEEAIRLYVQKYAKTAKIKNIVDTFESRLQSAQSFEETKMEVAKRKEEYSKIKNTITIIEKKIESGEEAKKFKNRIDTIDFKETIQAQLRGTVAKLSEEIKRKIDDVNTKNKSKHGELTKQEAKDMCAELAKFASSLEAEMRVKFEDIIHNNVQNNAENLLKQYREKLMSFSNDIQVESINLSPFKIMQGDIPSSTVEITNLINSSTQIKRVKIGEEWVANESKKWYKPWTWFDDDGYYRDVMGDKEYINSETLADKFFLPVEESLVDNSREAVKYANTQAVEIKKQFSKRFDELDKKLVEKLNDLKKYTSNEQEIVERLQDAENNLKWLEEIQREIKTILEI